MGSTADKLQKLVEGKQAIVNAVNSKANTSLSINSKLSDVANAISDITSGSSEIPEGYIKPSGNKEISSNGNYDITEYASVSVNVPTTGGSCEPTGLPLEVDSLPSSGTAVPNSGMVEKVYINTALSVEEVVSLLSQLTLSEDGKYVVLADFDNSKGISVLSMDGIYAIQIDGNFIFSNNVEELGFIGWQTSENFYIFGLNATDNLGPYSIGLQNSKLSSLFSTTPFGGSAGVEGAIYKVGSEPTIVPNSGYVENVYVNTSLSVEEVVNILSTINYNIYGSSYIVISNESGFVLTIQSHDGIYAILDFTNQVCYFANTEIEGLGVDFVGWNPNITDFSFTFNDTAISISELDGETFSVGLQNNLLTSLFSITPFSSDYYLCENGSFTKLVKEK